jgi:hypothetical protein
MPSLVQNGTWLKALASSPIRFVSSINIDIIRLNFVMGYLDVQIKAGKSIREVITELDIKYPGGSLSAAEKGLKNVSVYVNVITCDS